MARILETEVMVDPTQVAAYAAFDKSSMINLFINSLLNKFTNINNANIADIGCGSGDYYNKLCQTLPNCTFVGYDASQPMLDIAATRIDTSKVTLQNKNIDTDSFNENTFDGVISTMFLHQLPDASKFWNLLKTICKDNGFFIAWDLVRIEDDPTCDLLIDHFVPENETVFKQLYKDSLKAAFLPSEIQEQLTQANISATVETISFKDVGLGVDSPMGDNLFIVYVYGTL
jgi:ubiquinone/menaquinone biosynthesis C-methylase UbiE